MPHSFVLMFLGLIEELPVNQASAHVIKAGLFLQGYTGDRRGAVYTCK